MHSVKAARFVASTSSLAVCNVFRFGIMKVRNGSKADIPQPTRCARFGNRALQQNVPYSITSSARPSKENGIVSLSAFAVLRLTMN